MRLALAEREGFEPPIPVKVCLISSQVHSTALPSLRVLFSTTCGKLDSTIGPTIT
jgi:hypothetical protein